jgi:uncharacterized protein
MKLDRTIIGALHLGPLEGYQGHPGVDELTRLALADLQAFQDGGAQAVIFENNYDLPHTEKISGTNYSHMLTIGHQLKVAARVPLGVNVLWNDYRAALRLAKELNLAFIRVPVFIDVVRTDYGVFHPAGAAVATFRQEIGAESVKIFADIHVKHAKVISQYSIVESAHRAIAAHADGLIITGQWTGDAPNIDELRQVHEVVSDTPIIIGSGANADNISLLFRYANAAIVSTSLKAGSLKKDHTNLADWNQRIGVAKVQSLVKRAKN